MPVEPIHVVLGVIVRDGRVLVAWRDRRRHQGGCLEFPGGKVEPGESPEQALHRELMEEVGVDAEVGAPVIRLSHDYGDRRLLLDVREAYIDVDPAAAEGRVIEWRPIGALSPHEFPPANRAILNALKLPHEYAITLASPPEARSAASVASLERHFEQLLANGVRLVVLRAKGLDDEYHRPLARRLAGRARAAKTQLLLHDRPGQVEALGAAGVHLSQAAFAQVGNMRPVSSDRWFAVSCHDADEVRHAEAAGADFCVLGPVRATPGHEAPLEFSAFGNIVARANIPIYALGGMEREDLAEARAYGAQGIAGIRCFAM